MPLTKFQSKRKYQVSFKIFDNQYFPSFGTLLNKRQNSTPSQSSAKLFNFETEEVKGDECAERKCYIYFLHRDFVK